MWVLESEPWFSEPSLQPSKTKTKTEKKPFLRIGFKLDERGWIRMVETLGSPMENRTPFQESNFALEGTGVMELLKGQAQKELWDSLSLGPVCPLSVKE